MSTQIYDISWPAVEQRVNHMNSSGRCEKRSHTQIFENDRSVSYKAADDNEQH